MKLRLFLLRLFRHAYSANDPFPRMLFFWHMLVHPSESNKDAVKFVNDNLSALDKSDTALVEKMRAKPIFASSGTIADFGSYMEIGIRHSIAHIVRWGTDYKSLDMDNLNDIRHVGAASTILESLCRLRLERDFRLEVGFDQTILRIVT